jgi:toxin ParE1/3/4
MAKVRYTRRAREDLLEIWVWIASDSPATADRVYDAIEKRCDSLRHHSELGRPRPEIGEGVRSLVIERWLAFFGSSKTACKSCALSMAPATSPN